MKYEIVASSSAGNCVVVDGLIAIDMGVPYRKIERYAKELKLVLLTHVHSDHFWKPTVKRLSYDRPTLKWACRDWMVAPLLECGVDKRNIHVFEPDQWMYYAEPLSIMVCPFDTQHNIPNCGWKLWRNQRDSLFYATDLGHLEGIEAKDYGIYMLEANHTKAEIEAAVAKAQETGNFTYRTRAAENHLSYEQAVDWLATQIIDTRKSIWVPMHQHKEKEEEHEQDTTTVETYR